MNAASGTSTIENTQVQNRFLRQLVEELEAGLRLYWKSAYDVLDNSSVRLHSPSPKYFSLENNFFSVLFLYSYVRAGIPESRRIFFSAANQCLRGMVTGCDNILDNEYKMTLDTDLPPEASKFRSILDIMVSDRVLFSILHTAYQAGDLSFEDVLSANRASLHALLKSGVQEASEEPGAGTILPPEEVLFKVHPMKTGILFQAPWVLPELLESGPMNYIADIKEGLFKIGMGCQIMDDMVDLSMDVRMNRHNYVASLIHHGVNQEEKNGLDVCLTFEGPDPDFLIQFPEAKTASAQKALFFLQAGTQLLFEEEHEFMIPFAIDFFARRIGADRFFDWDCGA